MGLLFGVAQAPVVANLLAISIRCFFVMFLLSTRMSAIPMKYRIIAAVYFLIMPNIEEGYVNITNAHWYLALYLLAIILAERGKTLFWKAHDYAVLIISGLSGPFIIFLALPLIIRKLSVYKNPITAIKHINAFEAVAAALSLIQLLAVLITSNSTRVDVTLGASFELLARIISMRVFAETFFGPELSVKVPFHPVLCMALFVIFLGILVYLLIRSGWKFRAAAIFPIIMLGFALAKPMVTLTDSAWEVMLIPGSGQRYFFITNFAFFCLILYAIYRIMPSRLEAPSLALACLVLLYTTYHDFFMAPVPYQGYQEGMENFQKAEPGTRVTIPTTPQGWSMTLEKK
ncbi:hypothetical protein ACUN8C_04305 [Kushneria sp. Sum13]|uniref:hypothetical protein n=1 Tax=Kushneria sp. Sum13 TaxID=3459196 RepID=UPI00404523E8